MSQYLVLIYGDEKALAEAGEGAMQEVMEGHDAFSKQHAAAIAGGNALQGRDTATSIRPSNGSFVVTDGPFLETKEVIGGYYLIEATDLDEALATAKGIPMPAGGVEVRPVMVFS